MNTYYMVKLENFGFTCVDTFNTYKEAYDFGLSKGYMFEVIMVSK